MRIARIEKLIMLLLVTGASGAGKSTVRQAVAPRLAPDVLAVELADLVTIPEHPDTAWRQESVEVVIRHALALQRERRHLLMSGDPVVAGEVLAVPSAIRLDGFAACLLDVRPDVQVARLRERGDPEDLLIHHVRLAEWMRGHAANPQHRQDVIMAHGWAAMRWERWRDWSADDPRWGTPTIDTSDLTQDDVAGRVLAWCRSALDGSPSVPVLSGTWWETDSLR